MRTLEMTDDDGDALSIIHDDTSLWITCTADGEEVTVGPLSTASVTTLLSAAVEFREAS